jgi:hypothetical protein
MYCQFGAVESTDLFVGTASSPLQVLRITLQRSCDEPIPVTVSGRGVSGQGEIPPGDGTVTIELGVRVEPGGAIGAASGHELPVELSAELPDGGTAISTATLRVERPGYTMHLVSHFHYDPVWWNTQAAYTSSWDWLTDDGGTRPLWEHNGFALVDAHLELALRDPDYRFVLAEIDYLKPYFDLHPERRADLRRLMDAGRVELLGGTYNEPNTNLTGAELTIRNIVYGIGYQREILRGDPATAWQLDAFGHDPQFPGYLAEAGLTGSAWARGPFHQWGPMLKTFGVSKGDATVMQFPASSSGSRPAGPGYSPTTCPTTIRPAGRSTRRPAWPRPRRPPTSCIAGSNRSAPPGTSCCRWAPTTRHRTSGSPRSTGPGTRGMSGRASSAPPHATSSTPSGPSRPNPESRRARRPGT